MGRQGGGPQSAQKMVFREGHSQRDTAKVKVQKLAAVG